MSRLKTKPSRAKPKPNPFLAAALICENVITDQEGVLTVVRIVDKFTIRPEVTIGNQTVSLGNIPIMISLRVLIILKGGRGKHTLELILKQAKWSTDYVGDSIGC